MDQEPITEEEFQKGMDDMTEDYVRDAFIQDFETMGMSEEQIKAILLRLSQMIIRVAASL